MTLFPSIQPAAARVDTALPLAREVMWDFEANAPIWSGGAPLYVTGRDAVAVWAFKALSTDRFRWPIYTWDYGCELRALTGTQWTAETKKAEAARLVRECLTINPYITDVTDVDVAFADGTLTVSATILTIYGEVTVHV